MSNVYIVPADHSADRAEILTKAREHRAYWLHQVIGRVHEDHQAAALAALLEHERVETETLHEYIASWRETAAHAYQQGRIEGSREMAQTLGALAPPTPEVPPTRH
jgi:hypothetical protein